MHTSFLTELLADILAYSEDNGLTKSAFGIAAVGDPNFVSDLTNGREPRSRVVTRVREYMATGVTHEQTKEGRAA